MVFYVTNFSKPATFIKYWKTVKDKLPDAHKKLMDKWPFKHFLNLPEVQFSDNLFTELFKFWDFESNCFNFNGNCVEPTADDFCVILGLSGCGCDIEQKKKRLQVEDITGDLAKKFFPGTATLKWKAMEKKLNDHLTDKGFASPDEWVTLLSIYFLATTLFSRSSNTIPMFLFNYLSKFDDLWSIKWGRCAYEETVKNFKELAELVCGRRELVKSDDGALQGCPLGLLLWLFEILQPVRFRRSSLGTVPRFLKWQLDVSSDRDIQALFSCLDDKNFRCTNIVACLEECWVFILPAKDKRDAYLASHGAMGSKFLGALACIGSLLRNCSRALSRCAFSEVVRCTIDQTLVEEFRKCVSYLVDFQSTILNSDAMETNLVDCNAPKSGTHSEWKVPCNENDDKGCDSPLCLSKWSDMPGNNFVHGSSSSSGKRRLFSYDLLDCFPDHGKVSQSLIISC